MCGTQSFASATPFKRSHTLPPSEMKSLYGSITRSAVICLLYVTFAMVSRELRCVLREDLVVIVGQVVALKRGGGERAIRNTQPSVLQLSTYDSSMDWRVSRTRLNCSVQQGQASRCSCTLTSSPS